jgi:hypothetical protein
MYAFLDQLPLFLGQMGVVSRRVADPAVFWFHRSILNDHSDADHPRSPGRGRMPVAGHMWAAPLQAAGNLADQQQHDNRWSSRPWWGHND